VTNIADYAWLIGSEAAVWLARLSNDNRPQLQQLDSLRRELPAERARLLVEQCELRRRAADKYGDRAVQMFFTRVLLEQATDRWIARYKADRLAAAGAAALADYCCGIGGDLLAMAERGAATGWDSSETACLLALENSNHAAAVRCDDVTNCDPSPGEAWHLDPDRRAGGQRTSAVNYYLPGPDLVDRWLRSNACGAVKLAPAAEAPATWQVDGECEWMTRDRECRQQVVWFGALATAIGKRRATVVERDGRVATLIGDPNAPCEPADQPGAFLYEPDPSVLAAKLVGTLAATHGWSTLGAGGAYLTGDACVNDSHATGFVVLDCLPLRIATLSKYLAERSVGHVEIKKRGVAVAPDDMRRRLKLRGDNSAIVVLTRIGRREVAIVVERISP
jgi:hypothetical protein